MSECSGIGARALTDRLERAEKTIHLVVVDMVMRLDDNRSVWGAA